VYSRVIEKSLLNNKKILHVPEFCEINKHIPELNVYQQVKGKEGTRGGGGGRATLKGAHKINAYGFGAHWIRSPK